jgi:glycerate-2-kinase
MPKDIRNIYVLGAVNAAPAMAREVELILGNGIAEGIIVTKYDHSLPLEHIRCLEAGHPLPDEAGLLAGIEIIGLLNRAGNKDVVIALISGGASALLIDCPPGATLTEVQQVFSALLASGASIAEMNIVRKHLSPAIKGGQLIRTACPATVVSFILSDVPGDGLETIASGPTVPDPSTFMDAYHILVSRHLVEKLPASVVNWLKKGMQNEIAETAKAEEKIFERTYNFLIGTNHIALKAAQRAAEKLGYHTSILSESLTGEAKFKAIDLVKQIENYNGTRPACLLAGGETTVTIRGKGTGGRNQEFALAALTALKDNTVVILAAGTDGTDGPTPAAGAVIDGDTLAAVREKKLFPQNYLDNNDSFAFFQQVGGHIITGPTQTNVMDVVIALIT